MTDGGDDVARTSQPREMSLTRADGGYWLEIEEVKVPLLVIDECSRIVETNRRLAIITGHTREELLNSDVCGLFPDLASNPRPNPLSETGAYRAHAFGPDALINVARKNGSIFPARLISTPAYSAAHGAVQIVAVVSNGQLRLEELGLRGMLESAPDATLVLDRDGRIRVVNQRAAGLFGLQREQLEGHDVRALFSDTYAEDAQAWFAERYEHALEGGSLGGQVSSFPLQAQHADGRGFPIEVAASALHVGEGMFLRVSVRDITERVRLQAGAEEMKAHFLATVSHELRTPLASVLGYAELLEELPDEELGQQARRFVGVIARNAQRELRLVDDLLTIVSIESGQMSVVPRLMDLLEVVHQSCETLAPAAREAGVRLAVECAEPGMLMMGDPQRIGQALDNVTANAVKFSPRDHDVTLALARNGDDVELRVIDHGPGIPLYERLRAFDRLFRGADAIAAEKAGAGLGLAIVKAIVDAHRGRVALHCPETGGTQVSMLLPATAGPQEP